MSNCTNCIMSNCTNCIMSNCTNCIIVTHLSSGDNFTVYPLILELLKKYIVYIADLWYHLFDYEGNGTFCKSFNSFECELNLLQKN